MIASEIIKSVYGMTCENVYVDLRGIIRPRKNPTPGLYYFDGQVFYRKKKTIWLESTPRGHNWFYEEYVNGRIKPTT